jgi:endonuclease/exonuclease/phosphatase (EEP) superfamily protein YafD
MLKFYIVIFLVITHNSTWAAHPLNFWDIYNVLPEEESLLTMGVGSETEFKTKSIKTLIWNIKKAKLSNWHQEFIYFSKDKDLILLQEAYTSARFTSTLKVLPKYRWDLGISFIENKKNNATGTMIGSYVKPITVEVEHSPDFEPLSETPKSMTVAKYKTPQAEGELLVISVHAINFKGLESFTRQMDEAEEILSIHKGPILFAGDFNTWNRARTTHLIELCKKYNLEEVKFQRGDLRTKFGKYYLDHSFTRGLKITMAQVLPSNNGSDHSPLFLEFSIHKD